MHRTDIKKLVELIDSLKSTSTQALYRGLGMWSVLNPARYGRIANLLVAPISDDPVVGRGSA